MRQLHAAGPKIRLQQGESIMPIQRTGTLALIVLTAPSIALAADVRELSEGCETALALSAIPKHLRAGAGVYLLGVSSWDYDPRNATIATRSFRSVSTRRPGMPISWRYSTPAR